MIKTFTYAFTKKLFLSGLMAFISVAVVFAQAPVISSFSPASGPVGTVVTINGTGFNAIAAKNIVFFGATMAKVTGASTTSLTVTAPAGATYQPVTVLNSGTGLSASSVQPFRTIFTPVKGAITKDDFMPPVNFNTGGYCSGIVIGDIDGDGKADLVMANTSGAAISVLRNTSITGSINTGSFAAKVDFKGGDSPYQIAIADLDGDGKLDVAVTNSDGRTVNIFRNTSSPGSISFAVPIPLTTQGSGLGIAIADIDGDGKPDIVVVNSAYPALSIWRNLSTPGLLTTNSFDFRVDFTNGQFVNGGDQVAVADLDQDGKPDIAITDHADNVVSVFHNSSTRGIQFDNNNSFAAPVAFPAGSSPYGIAIGDLDADGKPDIVAANLNNNTITVLRNVTSGGVITAGSFAPGIAFLTSKNPRFVAIGDLDGEGTPDIVVTNYVSNGFDNTLSVFRHTSVSGAISPLTFDPVINLSTNYGQIAVAIGDLDGDGRADLALPGISGGVNSNNNVAILRNNPLFPPTVPPTNVTFTGTGTNTTTVSWTNGNGSARAVFITAAAGGSLVLKNYTTYTSNHVYGQGTLVTGSTKWYCIYDSTTNSVNIRGLSAGATYRVMAIEYTGTAGAENYLNSGGNGNPAVFTTLTGGPVAIDSIKRLTSSPANTGTVQFAVSFAAAVTGLKAGNFSLAVSGGVTGAGIIAVSGSGTSYIVTVNTGTGNGTIGLNLANATGILNGVFTPLPFIGDVYTINKLATLKPPVITSFSPASGPVGTVVTIKGTGFGAATGNNIVFFGATMAKVTAANSTSITVTVPVGATYQPITLLNSSTALSGYSAEPFTTTFTPRKGSITNADFNPRLVLNTGGFATGIVITDVDGDGKPDLVLANARSNSISIFRNISASGSLTAGSFAPQVDVPGGAYKVAVGDLDGDGKPDLAVIGDSTLSIFRNIATPGAITAGSFAAKVDFAVIYSRYAITPTDIVISDLDGDGKPDLIVSSGDISMFSIFRNTTTAGAFTANSFSRRVDFDNGGPPFSQGIFYTNKIAVGDLDGDGKPDLAITDELLNTVSVWRNTTTAGAINSTGSFAAPVRFNTGLGPGPIAIDDLDGDGKPDLVIGNTGDNTISLFRNTSAKGSITAGSFDARVDLASNGDGFEVDDIAIADIDGDGKPDIATAIVLGNTISVYRNLSTTGSFSTYSFAPRIDLISGSYSSEIAIGDLDGDGKPDIAITNSSAEPGAHSVSILHNNPFFTPTSQGTNVTFTNITTNSTTASWTNGDGLERAVFIAELSNGNPLPVNSIKYADSPVFGSGAQIGTSGWYCVYDSTGTSVNITGLSAGATYRVMVVDHNGTLGAENYLTATSAGNPANVTTATGGPVAINSINLVTTNPTDAVSVQYSVTFGSPVTGLNTGNFALVVTGAISGAAITSVTGSGANYIVTVNTGTGSGTVGLNLVTGTGLSPALITGLPFTGLIYTVHKTPSADSAPVIVFFSPTRGPTGTPVVIKGTGFNAAAAGNIVFFGATMAKVTAASTTSLTVVVPAGATYLPISVLNTGNALTGFSSQPFLATFTPSKGTITAADFLPPVSFNTGIGPTSVVISDIDGDGKPDLVVANGSSNTISVLRNTSVTGSITPASFAPKVDFATGNYPGGIVVGDLDGDGKPDIAFLTKSNKISILRNTSIRGSITAGSFAPGIDITAGLSPGQLLISDIDGDGKPDLVFETHFGIANAPPSTLIDTLFVMRNISARGVLTPGSFGPKVNMHIGHGEVDEYLTAGDLDGDGKPELIVGRFSYYQVAVFYNTATTGSITPNSFAAPVPFTTGLVPIYLAISDLDGDGKPDLAVGGLSVLRNTSTVGSITGNSFAARVDYPGGISGALAIGDLDGDGKPDIVGGNYSDPIAAYHNNTTVGAINSGSFDPVIQINTSSGFQTYNVAVGDLDGDGRPDLVAVLYNQNAVGGLVVLQNAPFIAPATQGTNVVFSKTAANNTTASWTNGNGQARAVFIGATSAGSPLPINRTTYSANAAYGLGTQVGTTGWYCIYNGTGSTVNITGLSSGTTYRVMVVEYNGAPGAQNYLTDTATRNPANVTTLPGGPVAINSISLVSPIFTNLASVQFKTTFASAITGLTAADFKLATTGAVTGASITSVSGLGTSYIITVNAGTGDGTIGLNLVSATGVKPGIITPLPFTGAVYTIDRTLPAITISNPSVSSVLSGTDTVSYTVNYADIHFYTSNLTASSITQNSTGTAKGTVTISGSDTSYVVSISNITGSGSLGISIAAGTASDLAGNNAPAAGPSVTFLVDPVLANLTINSGTLAPVFSSTTLTYLAQVSNSTSSLLVTPTPADPTATVTLNGGNPSIPVNLVVGLNTITIKVTSPDGKASTIYILSVTRAAPGVTGLPPKIAYSNGSIVLANAQPLTAVPTNTGGAVPATNYGQVTTFAGSLTETAGYINATGTAAQFNFPQQMVSDPAGNVYVADANNNAIRKITPAGVVTTFAGSLTGAAGLQDGPGTSALFSLPDGLAVDGTGNLFVADYQNNAIRKIDISGSVTTFYNTVATFGPGGLCFDASGNLIVAAQDASQIIRITPAGIASVIAGSTPGYINSTGTAAQFNAPADVKADASGNIYVADFNNNAIRKIDPSGAVTTIAGSAVSGNAPGYANGVGTAAVFNNPTGLSLAPGGMIYVADIYNNDIRRIAPDGTVTLIAGSAAQVPGDADGIGTVAAFNLPVYVSVDATGTGYVAEFGGNRIRKLTLTGYTLKGTLPQGLAFNPTTGAISGTPVIPFTAKTDTITAFNAYGFSTTVVTISYQKSSTVATLVNLVPSSGTLAPSFASSTTAYTDSVPNAVSSITLTPTATDTTSTIMVNGIAVSSGKASGAIPLAVGPNVITTVVTAQDGTTKDTYTVTVNRAALSTVATLNGLTISQGALTPVFATGTLNYSDGVANTITSVTVTPVTTDINATLKVNGIAVASGTASGAIPLAVGPNTITTVVTAQDGITTATYTIVVTRAPSNDATLTDLTLSSGPLIPVFTSGTLNYSAAVANTVTSVTLTPFTNDVNATVTVNGAAVVSGAASGAIPLAVGPNVITIVVTAQDGVTKDTYTVIVTRAADTDATLVNLTVSQGTLSPVFSSGTTSYTDGVPNSTTSITVTPATSDNAATITVNGASVTSGTASAPIALNVGPNTITTTVTAQDGITKDTYTVIVTRAADADATLVNLTVSRGTLSPVFNSGTITYTDGVPNSTTSITVTPTTSDNAATITVNGAAVTSGTPSGAIALAIGPNTITTVITAADGTTTDTYTVIVTRATSADATLVNLTVSQGTLDPSFSSGNTAYTDSVSNSVTSITVTPTTSDNAATITVNGAAVKSGTPSDAIPLAPGLNTVTVVVTAQDGVTTDTYTVTVYRAESLTTLIANNVLTPNGDGKNDVWVIRDIQLYPQNNVTIYDKAGRVVYAKHGYNNDWDGTLNGAPLAEGTYYYIVDLGLNLQKFKGYIGIVRN